MKRTFTLFGMALFYLTSSSLLLAQSTTGTILGRVTDPTGAAVPKAIITITNTLTSETHSAETSDEGEYLVPRLPVGVYRVEARPSGYKRTVRDGVILEVNQESRVDLALQLGATTETVEVKADNLQVNTYTTELGELVDAKKVTDLPLNGRNVYSLLVTLPGASMINAQAYATRDNNTFVVNGGRATTNTCFVDGGFNNDIWRNQCSTPPNPDAVQEFRLLSSNADVEFGRMPGAFMNIVTKSGTNSFHGTAYEYVRNDAFDATTFFRTSVDPLKQNQFGGTLGGPLVKNKLFLFGSWEELKRRSPAVINSVAVPTALERAGDFSQSSATITDPLTGQPFPGNIIPAERFDKVGKAIIDDIPLPNNSFGTYTARLTAPVDTWQYLLKGDYELRRQQKISVSWFQMNSTQGNPFAFFNQIPGMGDRVDTVRQDNLVVNHTWIVGSNIVNELRFNLMRRTTPWTMVDGKTFDQYGMNFHSGGVTPTAPRIYLAGRFSTGAWTAKGDDHSYGGNETLTWIRGKHNIKLGTLVMFGHYSEAGISTGGGQIWDWGSMTGDTVADLLVGAVSSFSEDSGHTPDLNPKYIHPFVQDTWKVTPRVTLTAGLRYEFTTPMEWTKHYQPTFVPGVQSTVFPNAPTGMLFYGDKGVHGAARPGDYKDFAPRLGLAWDPFGDGKTSVRFGYGLYYLSAYGDGIRASQPYVLSITLNNVTNLTDPWASFPGGDPFPYKVPSGSAASFTTPMSLIVFDQHVVTPRLSQLNVSVQRQLTNSLGLQVGYVGTIGRHLSGNIDQNAPPYGPGATSGNVDARRPYQSFQSIGTYFTRYNSSYNALQVVATQRMAHGLTFNANYTWAKSIDLISFDSYNGELHFTDSFNPGVERGNSDNVPRHIFNLSGTYNLPKVQTLGTIGNYLVNGWQANAMLTVRTGMPISIGCNCDSNKQGNANNRADLVGNPSSHFSNPLTDLWFNPVAFAVPADGTNGNTGRNAFYGPGYWNADMSFFRAFPIYREHQLQFRAELFNAFNHANLMNPHTGMTDPLFGRITDASTARIAQLGLRYSF